MAFNWSRVLTLCVLARLQGISGLVANLFAMSSELNCAVMYELRRKAVQSVYTCCAAAQSTETGHTVCEDLAAATCWKVLSMVIRVCTCRVEWS